MGKILLIEVKYLYVKYNWGSHICAVEWIGVNLWCVNPHLTNKMLVRVNSKLLFQWPDSFTKRVIKTNYMYGYIRPLDQISRACNCHCSQIEYCCPIGLLKSNIRVMCLWLGKHFQYMVNTCIKCTHAWYHHKDVSIRTK
jgi:hypothetical protein